MTQMMPTPPGPHHQNITKLSSRKPRLLKSPAPYRLSPSCLTQARTSVLTICFKRFKKLFKTNIVN
ncbi:hypothetical protein LDENG_00148350, partial [Lucifuga dentata]